MMKNILLLLFPILCVAQVPAYYNSVDFTQTGDNLKFQLANLISTTHTNELTYTPEVWNALKQADRDPDNPQNVFLIYGYNDNDANPDNDRTRNKDYSCHTSSCDGLWVREHIYPRSLGNPNLEFTGPGADAHHLRAIDYNMNNSRSNRKFAAGSGNAGIVSGGNWYPGDEWKGDIARMMMYMYVRYEDRCKATTVGVGSTSNSNFGDMPNIFLQWNTEDPVSQYEMNRNNLLQNMQGNRNPFIDNPYLATLMWNGPQATDTWGILSTTNVSIAEIIVYPTVTTGIVYVTNATDIKYTYQIYNALGQTASAAVSGNEINLNGNPTGIYYLNIQNNKTSKMVKIVLK